MSDARPPVDDFIVVGNPDGNRVGLFQASLQRLGRRPAQVVRWVDVLSGTADFARVVKSSTVVRIESPGKNWTVEHALLMLGADKSDVSLGDVYEDHGRIWHPHLWYRGLCSALERIEMQLSTSPVHRRMNSAADIAAMCDKRVCHARLCGEVPVPPSLGLVRSYEELIMRMREHNCCRVFVKLAHGSSASGVVAYETNGERHRAITTLEVVSDGQDLRLYNSREIRTYQDHGLIASLVDALCGYGVHVERWMPKGGIDGRVFDLRVVTIAGRANHVVVRMSRSPITNLHLLNTRGDVDKLRKRMGPDHWRAAMETCERTIRLFPGSHYAGVDLLIAPGDRIHAVLEVNAFGDLLPNVRHDGMDTYEAEVLAL